MFFATFSQFNISYDYIALSSYLLFAACLMHKENDPFWALEYVNKLSVSTVELLYVYFPEEIGAHVYNITARKRLSL